MKLKMTSYLFKVCNLCIALAGFMHWTKISLWLFGEYPYPENNAK